MEVCTHSRTSPLLGSALLCTCHWRTDRLDRQSTDSSAPTRKCAVPFGTSSRQESTGAIELQCVHGCVVCAHEVGWGRAKIEVPTQQTHTVPHKSAHPRASACAVAASLHQQYPALPAFLEARNLVDPKHVLSGGLVDQLFPAGAKQLAADDIASRHAAADAR